MEAAASTENRKRTRFPAAAWKTLRVSHSFHSPRPHLSPTAGGLDADPALSDTLRPSPGVAAFQPFPAGRVSTSGETPGPGRGTIGTLPRPRTNNLQVFVPSDSRSTAKPERSREHRYRGGTQSANRSRTRKMARQRGPGRRLRRRRSTGGVAISPKVRRASRVSPRASHSRACARLTSRRASS